MMKTLVLLCIAALMPLPSTAGAGIDHSFTPDIGGIKQLVEIKTDDADKPALLFLSGGPGSSMINNAAAFTDQLKDRFTIVQWDQRDAGKTLKLNPSPTRPTLARMQSDTLEVIEFVRAQLKQQKIYLLGSSWGNVLGFHVVKTHPELLSAYFAVNPVVNQLASEKQLLATLQRHFKDNPAASDELAAVSLPFKSGEDLFHLRKWLFHKEGKRFATTDGFRQGFLQWAGTWSPVWNEVMLIDLAGSLPAIDCPIYFFVGKDDIQTSTAITTAYFDAVRAPRKALFVFEKSGHQIHQDEPDKFQRTILGTLPPTPAGR